MQYCWKGVVVEGENLPLIGLLHSAAGFCGMCDITSLAFSSDVNREGVGDLQLLWTTDT